MINTFFRGRVVVDQMVVGVGEVKEGGKKRCPCRLHPSQIPRVLQRVSVK